MRRLVRQLAGRCARGILPAEWIQRLRDPVLAPGYCRRLIQELETAVTLAAKPDPLDDDYWTAVLRKYAHIVDKGLQRPDAEAGHGREACQQAASALAKITLPTALRDSSVHWAIERLRDYERLQSGQDLPTAERECETREMEYDGLLASIKARRSARSFRRRSVDTETVGKVVEAALWAPSSCNRQTIKVFGTHDADLASACMATCKGATCFGEYVPCFLAFCADVRPYVMPAEAWLPHVDVALGTQNSCLAADSLGLSLTLLSWCHRSDDEERRLRELLDIPPHCGIALCGAMGYPDKSGPAPLRKPVESTCVLRRASARTHDVQEEGGIPRSHRPDAFPKPVDKESDSLSPLSF
ncbi:MAG: nitroreductase family protein [Phycisphaerae bacterium]|nr:nitroreductase family protein [Phycisphaerae bacterium]